MTTVEIRAEKLALAKFTRSDQWPKIRRQFLKLHPNCEVCGVKKRIEAHHIRPFYLFPELELDPSNLITLCEGNVNHHLFVGHLMSYKSYNPTVREDSILWNARIKSRPK